MKLILSIYLRNYSLEHRDLANSLYKTVLDKNKSLKIKLNKLPNDSIIEIFFYGKDVYIGSDDVYYMSRLKDELIT